MNDALRHVGKLDRMPLDRSRKLVFLINVLPICPVLRNEQPVPRRAAISLRGVGIDNESDQVS